MGKRQNCSMKISLMSCTIRSFNCSVVNLYFFVSSFFCNLQRSCIRFTDRQITKIVFWPVITVLGEMYLMLKHSRYFCFFLCQIQYSYTNRKLREYMKLIKLKNSNSFPQFLYVEYFQYWLAGRNFRVVIICLMKEWLTEL